MHPSRTPRDSTPLARLRGVLDRFGGPGRAGDADDGGVPPERGGAPAGSGGPGDVSVTVSDLTRTFGRVTALDDLSLSIGGPQIVGVAGPNGSGKTTLIRALLGLLAPTAGSASVSGTPSTAFAAADRARIGYMPQHDAVYDDLTVAENVGFFARLYGLDDRAAAVDAALSFVDLADRRDDRVATLSGGMVRRTSLACAVVHDPEVLFLDEPTVGLDPALRASMWAGFRDRRDAGTLTVVSTHYLGEASRCDRVLFLRAGRLLAFDTPEHFLERTGTSDLEAAFLALLDESPAGADDATVAPAAGDDTSGDGGSDGTVTDDGDGGGGGGERA